MALKLRRFDRAKCPCAELHQDLPQTSAAAAPHWKTVPKKRFKASKARAHAPETARVSGCCKPSDRWSDRCPATSRRFSPCFPTRKEPNAAIEHLLQPLLLLFAVLVVQDIVEHDRSSSASNPSRQKLDGMLSP